VGLLAVAAAFVVDFDTVGTLTESQWPCGSFLQASAPAKIARTPIFSPVLLHGRDSTLPRRPGPIRHVPLYARQISPLIWLRILLAYEENPEKGWKPLKGRRDATENGMEELTYNILTQYVLLCGLFLPDKRWPAQTHGLEAGTSIRSQ
jgi:hypothetical protein